LFMQTLHRPQTRPILSAVRLCLCAVLLCLTGFLPARAQTLAQRIRSRLMSHREQLGTPAQRLLVGKLNIGARGQGHNREAVRITFNDFEGAATYRTGRAQDCDSFHHRYLQSNSCPYAETNFAPKTANSKNATGKASSRASMRSRIPP